VQGAKLTYTVDCGP